MLARTGAAVERFRTENIRMTNATLDALIARQTILDDERLIRRTLALYCTLLDDRRFDDWSQVFTEDAEWIIPGTAFKGRAAIAAGVGATQPSVVGRVKHLSHPPAIEFTSFRTARAWSDVVVLSRNREGVWKILAAGRYYDDLEKEDGAWRLRRRQADIDTTTNPLPGLVAPPSP